MTDKKPAERAFSAWHKMADEVKEDDVIVDASVYSGEVTVARGVASRRNTPTSSTAFSNRNEGNSVKDKIKECRAAYNNIGIIGNVIDIMTDFALEGFQITHEIESVERLFTRWAEKVDLYSIVEEVLRGIFRDGNVPILTHNAKIGSDEISTLRKVASKNCSSLFADSSEGSGKIPYKFTVLDVTSLTSSKADLFGRKQYTYQFSKEMVDIAIRATDEESKALVTSLKDGLVDSQWSTFKKTGQYPLPAEKLALLYYKKDSFSPWANPMMWRIIDDLKFKCTLRNMDISIAESVTNSITIFKLGNVKEGIIPSAIRLQKFASLLRNPSKSKQIVWDDLVSIESNEPDTGKILGDLKYQQVNADILAGLGISEVLIGGAGGNYSNSFLSCRTLLERLETGRAKVLKWVREQLKAVAKGIGASKVPFVKFAHMSLRDEASEKKMLLELVDRNVISYKTLLERFGENMDVEIKRMKREDKIREKNKEKYPYALTKVGKFGPQNMNNSDDEDKALPTAQGPQGEKGGRPAGDDTKQTVKRDTKPKGMSWKELFPYAAKAYSVLSAIQSEDVAYKKLCLLTEDRVVNFNMSTLIDSMEEDYETVENMEKIADTIDNMCDQMIVKFKEKIGREPDQKEFISLRNSAWAIYQSRIKKE